MKSGIGGAFLGSILGLMLGGAMFGPLGSAVGILFGAVVGFVIMTPLSVAAVGQAAKTPFTVKCPETGEDVEITLDSREAARAEFWNRRQNIETCSRFRGRPTCDQACVGDLEI